MTEPQPSFIERKERWARKMSGKARPAVRSEERLPPGQHLTSGVAIASELYERAAELRDAIRLLETRQTSV